MDKNTITGFILIAAVLIGFSWWTQPSEEQKAQMRLQDSLENVARVKAEQTKKAAEKAALDKKAQELVEASQDTTALFHNALSGNAEKVVLKNKKLELTLSTKGGTVTKAIIRGYKDQKGNPDVVLFDEKEQQLKFMMAGKDKNIITILVNTGSGNTQLCHLRITVVVWLTENLCLFQLKIFRMRCQSIVQPINILGSDIDIYLDGIVSRTV